MAQFVEVPLERLDSQTLAALLAEFASRDGTDYGEVECTLEEKVAQLHGRLQRSESVLLYDVDSEQWDIVCPDRARELIAGGGQ